jgi:N-acetylglucosaminyldiphosphoundecaprenol N-acetyl-beta-D-mannosaminyltransferase
MRVDATSYEKAAQCIVTWARAGVGRYVCVANVHMAMEAYDDPEFRDVINNAALVTSDGMPLVWGLRLLGVPEATRVYGPELTPYVCMHAEREGLAVAFVGSTDDILARLTRVLRERFPALVIAHTWSPPFRQLDPSEELEMLESLNRSQASIIFVGLGCPKQERWMARYHGQVNATMIGVGAAFDFIAGAKAKAPPAMQTLGLEWLFRLITEPRRLWKRYVYHNPRFVFLFGAQLLRHRLGHDSAGTCGI